VRSRYKRAKLKLNNQNYEILNNKIRIMKESTERNNAWFY